MARFLLVVPCRDGMALRLEWPHIDLQRAVWTMPGKLTKNRDAHRLHLHSLAIDILQLRQLATNGEGLVFPSPVAGKPISTLRSIRDALAKKTGIFAWTWHDCRRSFATALGEAGTSEVVVDAVLNHRQAATRGGVLGTYQKASRWPEQVRAMQLWGRLLAEAIEGCESEAKSVEPTHPA